jgi:hypothetical protein
MSESEINDITEKVKEYGEISKTIKITQEKLKILNKKKKELHKEVVPKLKTNNVTKCNLPYGTLKVTSVKRKILPNKTNIKDKYISFFSSRACEPDFVNGTPQERTEILHKYIYVDNIEYSESQSISMVYNKEFNQQFKQLSI